MTLYNLVMLIALIESNNDPAAVGDGGRAIGTHQIHPIMLREVNRIIKKTNDKATHKFVLSDRRDRMKSAVMCMTYLRYQQKRYKVKFGQDPSNYQLICSWQSGSIMKSATKQYASRVTDILSKDN